MPAHRRRGVGNASDRRHKARAPATGTRDRRRHCRDSPTRGPGEMRISARSKCLAAFAGRLFAASATA